MSLENSPPTRPQIHRWFAKAGLISLLAMSLISAIGQIGVNSLVAPLIPQTAKIHAASEQAIRAQTISILATDLGSAKRPGLLYTHRTQLAAELNEFEAVHRGLMFGDKNRGLSASMSPNVHELMTDPINGLDRFARDFVDQVRRDFLSDALSVDDGLADGLSEVIQIQLSPRLRALTAQLALETSNSVRKVQATLISLFSVAVLVMLILGRLVLRPLALKVSKIIIADVDAKKGNLVRYDEVTGLASKSQLLTFMTDLCEQTQSHDLRSAILDIEIQGIDDVRSAIDEKDADDLIATIARRIESVCRSGDFISRVGENEFVVVLTSIDDDMALNNMTNALRTKLSIPLIIDAQSFKFNSKIGIKIATSKDRVPAAMLNQAATALKAAKASDSYDIQFFSNRSEPKAKQRESDLEQVKKGLKDGQFAAHLQPIIDMETDATLGLEAFARWHHPKRGILQPIHFMEVIENRGLANDLTRIILGNALNAHKDWQAKSIAVPYISINLDVTQLGDRTFVDELKWILDSHDLDPSRIAFEFSESAFLPGSPREAKENLRRLAAHGFRLILDDFGTHGLRLNAIDDIPLEHAKLDRAFVANLDSETEQQRTARILVEHAQKTQVKVVAAGVETPAERSILKHMKADAIQGYLICEPADAEQITQWLEQASKHADRKVA